MEKNLEYLSEEELKELDSEVLEDYLLTLESIDASLEEIINENKEEDIEDDKK